jgi:peptidoglycan/xylan/chitin deacetylase (PgdA/CDA1 family)
MRAVALLFHDVVEDDAWDSSGFTNPGSAKYKLGRQDFEAHLHAVAHACSSPPITACDLQYTETCRPSAILTFDDGGVSAGTVIADLLAQNEWRAHFFVTAGYIGKRGFLNKEQIRGLRKQNHVIGSHSYSHPTRISHCDDRTLNYEWSRSVDILSDVLGESVDTASVPGGYYSRRVAESAAAAGIRILFNSEPTTKTRTLGGCTVFGRFGIVRGDPAPLSGELLSTYGIARLRQSLFWNAKKIPKTIAGRPYLAIRQYLLRHK